MAVGRTVAATAGANRPTPCIPIPSNQPRSFRGQLRCLICFSQTHLPPKHQLRPQCQQKQSKSSILAARYIMGFWSRQTRFDVNGEVGAEKSAAAIRPADMQSRYPISRSHSERPNCNQEGFL